MEKLVGVLGNIMSGLGKKALDETKNELVANLEIKGISLRRANALMSGRRLESFITLRQPIPIRVVSGPSR